MNSIIIALCIILVATIIGAIFFSKRDNKKFDSDIRPIAIEETDLEEDVTYTKAAMKAALLDDRDYCDSGSGFNLANLTIGFVMLLITITIGGSILVEMGDVVNNMAVNNSTSTVEVVESFGSLFPVFFFMIMVMTTILIISLLRRCKYD